MRNLHHKQCLCNHLARTAALAMSLLLGSQASMAVELASPDQQIRLRIHLSEAGDSPLSYSVTFNVKPVLVDSAISFIAPGNKTIGARLRASDEPVYSANDTEWRPVYGERSLIRDHYNQVSLTGEDTQTGFLLRYEFRCYNAGVAFRTTLLPAEPGTQVKVDSEQSEFCFTGDYPAWRTQNPQGEYSRVSLSSLGGSVERPLVVKVDDEAYVAIAEAGLVNYAPMLLRRDSHRKTCLVSQLGGPVEAAGELTTPWRVVMLGKNAGELLENNDIILNLSEPCALEDTSWIKPGKVIRDYSLSTDGALACVDFAASHHFQYVEFDAGWYGNEYEDASDATTVTVDRRRSPGPLDMHRVIEYAQQQGIGIIVYVNRRAIEKQLDEILPLYKKWGIAGVKYGFVRTGDQASTAWLHEAVRKAAAHQLMVDIHDKYRPTGYSRTYPNLMSQEGVRGDEASPSGHQTTTTLFTRYLAGAADFTICYFDGRVNENWTHGHQLAKTVCTYSPWQFMFWYDLPPAQGESEPQAFGEIVETPELEYFSQVPTVWDDTRVLAGEIGQYAVIARRSGQDWYIGAMNGSEPRELRIPLDFLTADADYRSQVYRDDPSLETRTNIRVEASTLHATDELNWNLLANGGQVARLTPVEVDVIDSPGPSEVSAWKERLNGKDK